MGPWCDVELRGQVCNAAAERDAEIARLREENETLRRHVEALARLTGDEAADVVREHDEARALLRRIAALPDYGGMGGETEEWWDELQQICRAAKVMLAGDRQEMSDGPKNLPEGHP